MNNKKYAAIGIAVGLVIVAGIIIFLRFEEGPEVVEPPITNAPPGATPTPQPQEKYVPKDGVIQPVLPLEQQADYIIDMTPVGFSPETLEIKKGDSVIWTNRDRYNYHQVVSVDPKYTEKGDCGTKMDICAPLKLGESFRVTFNVAGTWAYEDKIHPQLKGTIVVE